VWHFSWIKYAALAETILELSTDKKKKELSKKIASRAQSPSLID
jgi:hypothetical protein